MQAFAASANSGLRRNHTSRTLLSLNSTKCRSALPEWLDRETAAEPTKVVGGHANDQCRNMACNNGRRFLRRPSVVDVLNCARCIQIDPNKPFEPSIFASITVLTPATRLFPNGLNPCTDLFSKPAGALRDRFTLWTDAPSLRGATHFDVGLFEGSIRYIRPGS